MVKRSAAALGAFVLIPCLASAAGRRVGVVGVSADASLDGTAQVAQELLIQGLRQDAALDVTSGDLRARAGNDAVRAQKAQEGRAALAEAANKVGELDYVAALGKADEARQLFEDADLTRDFSGLLDAMTVRALALGRDGSGDHRADGVKEFIEIYSLAPDYALSRDRRSPLADGMVREAKEKIPSLGTASLEVRLPDGVGIVYVDGVLRGASPVEVKKLPPGSHYITVFAPGADLLQSRATAEAGQGVELRPQPAAEGAEYLTRRKALAEAARTDAIVPAARDLGAWMSAPDLLVASVTPAGVKLTRVTERGGAATLAVEPWDGTGAPLVAAAQKLLAPPGAALGEAVASSAPPPDRRLWAYVAYGGAAAAAIGGIALGVSAQSQANGTRQIPLVNQTQYDSAVSSAKVAAAFADVCYLLALGAAGFGTYWLLTSPSGAAEVAPPTPPPSGKDEFSFGIAPTRNGGALTFGGKF